MIVFCLIYILQIQNISTGFRETSHSVTFGICKHERILISEILGAAESNIESDLADIDITQTIVMNILNIKFHFRSSLTG